MSKRIYLLYSSKVALLLLLFVLLVLIVLRIDSDKAYALQWFDRKVFYPGAFSNEYIILGVIILFVVADKLLPDVERLTHKKRWIALFQFSVVTVAIYAMMSRDSFMDLLFAYPEIIFVLMIVAVVL